MARNLELKVLCDEATLADVRQRAFDAGSGPFTVLRQIDMYYRVEHGRLKLRTIEYETGDTSSELIAYRRPDETGSRWSDYQRVPLDSVTARGIDGALGLACGIASVVDKRREVAILGRTRIHLDRVAGLGSFIELETVAGPDDGEAELAREHEEVIRMLGIGHLEWIAGSYGELIAEQRRKEMHG